MDTMTAREAARRWGVSLRYVQRLLHDGRVPGAKKLGASWAIPALSAKPDDPRRAPGSRARYLACGLLSGVIPIGAAGPDAAAAAIADAGLRAQYLAELRYMRGDFQAVKDYFSALSPGDALYLCAANLAAVAAMSTGDYALYKKIEGAAAQIAARTGNRAAEILPALAAVSAYAPGIAPQWLKEGDFSGFSPEATPFLLYLWAKHFQGAQDFAPLLAVARATLCLRARSDEYTLLDIYFTALCACACYGLKRFDQARAYLDQALGMGMPHGFLAPFSEIALSVGGMLDAALREDYPDRREAVLGQLQGVYKNWLYFHNEFSKDNITLILSPREYQIAVLLREGKTYAQAARRMNLSVGRIKNILSVVYQKLQIRGKRELKRFIL